MIQLVPKVKYIIVAVTFFILIPASSTDVMPQIWRNITIMMVLLQLVEICLCLSVHF